MIWQGCASARLVFVFVIWVGVCFESSVVFGIGRTAVELEEATECRLPQHWGDGRQLVWSGPIFNRPYKIQSDLAAPNPSHIIHCQNAVVRDRLSECDSDVQWKIGQSNTTKTGIFLIVVRRSLGKALAKWDDKRNKIYDSNNGCRTPYIHDVESRNNPSAGFYSTEQPRSVIRCEPDMFQSQFGAMGSGKFVASEADALLHVASLKETKSEKSESGNDQTSSSVSENLRKRRKLNRIFSNQTFVVSFLWCCGLGTAALGWYEVIKGGLWFGVFFLLSSFLVVSAAINISVLQVGF